LAEATIEELPAAVAHLNPPNIIMITAATAII